MNQFITQIFILRIENLISEIFSYSQTIVSHKTKIDIFGFIISLIKNNIIDEITIIYPIPGYSYLDCDRDFGRIKKNRLKVEKVCFTSQWVNLIRKTDVNFNIDYENFPLTDDLEPDGTPIITVKEYKKFFEKFSVNNVKKLTQIRKIKFTQNGIFATTNLLSENFELEINLIKSDIIEKFDFITLNNAYKSYLPLKKAKFDDIKVY